MALKLFRVVWFLSVMVLFAVLLYGYAGWPEVLIIQDNPGDQITIGREALFYVMVIIIVLVNVMVYLIAKMFRSEENFRAWFHGLIISANIFFMIALNLVGVYNSNEKYDYSRIGFIIYGSVGLIVLWGITWPIYVLIQKFLPKQAV